MIFLPVLWEGCLKKSVAASEIFIPFWKTGCWTSQKKMEALSMVSKQVFNRMKSFASSPYNL
jgi:hypothetical protein